MNILHKRLGIQQMRMHFSCIIMQYHINAFFFFNRSLFGTYNNHYTCVVILDHLLIN